MADLVILERKPELKDLSVKKDTEFIRVDGATDEGHSQVSNKNRSIYDPRAVQQGLFYINPRKFSFFLWLFCCILCTIVYFDSISGFLH